MWVDFMLLMVPNVGGFHVINKKCYTVICYMSHSKRYTCDELFLLNPGEFDGSINRA